LTTVVTLSVRETVEPVCRHCHSRKMAKIVSRVSILRSEGSRLEGLADPASLAGLDGDDPKSVGRWMKDRGREMGEEAGAGFDKDVDEALEEAERAKESGGEGLDGDDREDL
jgi:hypothetical protein